MGCRLTDFVITDEWTAETISGLAVEMVAAKTKPTRWTKGIGGTLYKVNGRFQGFMSGGFESVRSEVSRRTPSNVEG